jgi:phage tail-like protein
MSDTNYYPPSKFYFSVNVIGSGTAAAAVTSIDASFQEITGIEAEFGVEEVAEGGENRYSHRLPKQAKYPPLVLKRGIVTQDSVLGEWVAATLGSTLSLPIIPQNLLVMLLDGKGDPMVAWGFANAWPLKWKTGSLNSQANEVLIESLEFSYSYFIRTTLTSALSIGAVMTQMAAGLT